jgi:hypothetical protein
LVKPELQLKVHVPPLQTGVPSAGAEQRLPQPLQLLGSLVRLTHAPPQFVLPFGQQTPLE